jgi:hypothetical protein
MTHEHFEHDDFLRDEIDQTPRTDATRGEDEARTDAPLDAWMIALAQQDTDVAPTAIPRDMMWARIKQHRARAHGELNGHVNGEGPAAVSAATQVSPLFAQRVPVRSSSWMLRVAGIAALLIGGMGIGRFLLPTTGASKYQTAIATSTARADSITALGLGPEALAALPPSSEPARVAMDEHLARTVALLVAVRNDEPSRKPGVDIGGWARELLGTTRLLLDEPQLGDERTRRLLQDLELVLAQIIQVRQSAPETARAPGETMRETNLLPRMRAAVSASRPGDDFTPGGGL